MTNEERKRALAVEFPVGCVVVSDDGPAEWRVVGTVIGHLPYVVKVRSANGAVWKVSATLIRRAVAA